ncbi:MAG: ubiquinone biosynthesis protein COQ4 [Bacteroidota bacterium]|nr:ubiquinone biosynthesis protein COQ4 [Bacteroidota bacterium]MDX5430890.1 ubiquinone biosynthesis protein COQ4 [Bacteroidota bacterium]MDX5469637.1 ubiquinone biosynthesis protein COQ4 [Bacteroidota bacterium]
MRRQLFTFLTLRVYFPFCHRVYHGKGELLSFASLQGMQLNSLGKKTAEFLIRHRLDPMPGYEGHDMKHTLLGYGPNMKGEIAMQFFEYGNGNRSAPVVVVMLFGAFFMPEEWPYFRRQYQRGAKASDISQLDLKEFAHLSLVQLKSQWNIC